MLGIKKQFIKNMIKLEIVSNVPGKLQLYIAQIKKVEDEYKIYEVYAENALKLLKGVERLDIDYTKGVATISYDPSVVGVQKVYKWLQVLIDVSIDYYDDLKQLWEKDQQTEEAVKVERIWQQMKPVLERALLRLN